MNKKEKDQVVLDPNRVAKEAAKLPPGTRYMELPKRGGIFHPFEAIIDFFYRLHTRDCPPRHQH
jgi:hypothetical protein